MSDASKESCIELGKLKPRDEHWQSRALAAEQERDQLKAELQQSNDAVEWIKKFGPELATRSILLPSISELRAILERIDK